MKQFKWHKIADSEAELSYNASGLTEVEVGSKRVCIAKAADKTFACAAKCPHASGTMAEGFVDALGNIVCPVHRYKFDLKNGRNVSGEGYFLKTYPLEVREDGVYVGIEEGGLFSWLK
jgi:nitrite reductase/ring-hydroxylating ferredoxin subunit